MKKGRSVYNIQINCDPGAVNSLIQSYLQANNSQLYKKDNEQFYMIGDAFNGYRYFNYSIQGQTLTIYAWFRGAFGDIMLEQNDLNMAAMNYRESLSTLFQEIDKLNNRGVVMNNNMNFDPNTGRPLNNGGANFDPNTGMPLNNGGANFDPNTGQPLNNNMNNSNNNSADPYMAMTTEARSGQNTAVNSNQFTNTFQNETVKKQEKMCEVGFWLSIVGLVFSFIGVAYGLILYILIFYFASQGLKTQKRGKAIASIVLTVISIVIIVLQVLSLS